MSKQILSFDAIGQEINLNSEDPKIFVDVLKLEMGFELWLLTEFKGHVFKGCMFDAYFFVIRRIK